VVGLVARELLGARILRENARLLQCGCPNHKGNFRRSLHVVLDKHKQGWYCFGCGVGGDSGTSAVFGADNVRTRPMPRGPARPGGLQ